MEKTQLLEIKYDKPNYEAIKKEMKWNEFAVPRLQSLEKEARHWGERTCYSQFRLPVKGERFCLNKFMGWIYEDKDLDSVYQGMCDECHKAWIGITESEPINKEPVEATKSDSMDWYQDQKPINIISWGGGSDSTMLILKYGHEVDEIIMADTGAEEIETYEYIKYFINRLPYDIRQKITIIKNDREGNIDDWHFEKKLQPMPFANRQCTDKWKLRVIHRYIRRTYGTKAVFNMFVGINKDEQIERERPLPTDMQLNFFIEHEMKLSQSDLEKLASRQKISVADYKERVRNALQTGARMKEGKLVGGVQYARNVYPLCEDGIGKADEIEFYKENGLQTPPKSGCYFCPMKSKAEWERQAVEQPILHENTKRIQENSTAKIKIMEMSEKKEAEMRCSCSNGLYDADDDEQVKYEIKLTGRGF